MLISDWSSDVASSDLQGGSRIPVGRQNDAEAEQGGEQHELAEREPGQPRHCYGEIAGPDDVGEGQREETACQKLVGNSGTNRPRPQSQRRTRQGGGAHRKRGVGGKRGDGRGDSGGRRRKKKTKK